jgi:hypothetical protein
MVKGRETVIDISLPLMIPIQEDEMGRHVVAEQEGEVVRPYGAVHSTLS